VQPLHDHGPSDEELVRLCQERLPGDRRPFRALAKRYRDKVINTAYRFLSDQQDAEDVAQDVFLKVYRGLSEFRAEASFSTWLYRITVNTCKNELRRRSRYPTLLEPDLETLGIYLSNTPSAEQSVLTREKRDIIQRTIEQLPATHREALILRDIQGLSYRETAAVLEIGLSAAKMRVRRARLAFRDIYGRDT